MKLKRKPPRNLWLYVPVGMAIAMLAAIAVFGSYVMWVARKTYPVAVWLVAAMMVARFFNG